MQHLEAEQNSGFELTKDRHPNLALTDNLWGVNWEKTDRVKTASLSSKHPSAVITRRFVVRVLMTYTNAF